MANYRVYEAAEELGVDSKQLILMRGSARDSREIVVGLPTRAKRSPPGLAAVAAAV